MDRFSHARMTFDVADSGPPRAPLVVLMHGFPEDRRSWAGVAAELAASGWRTLAPDLRGYSPGACPPGRRSYALDRVAGDVLALADAAGAERFHAVGHDWGAVLGWYLAVRHPERVASLAALSAPHPRAFLEALPKSAQALRSWYIAFFQLPLLPELLLGARRGRMLGALLRHDGLDAASARRYGARAAAGRMGGPLNWYRALPWSPREVLGSATVPCLYVWGEKDRYVSRAAAEACGRFVAGPYSFVSLEGAGHWLPEVAAGPVARLLLDHLGGAPAGP